LGKILHSYFDKSSPPLVFLRPVGFAPDDALRLMSAAKQMDETVRWRLPPPGVAPDAFLAHPACVSSSTHHLRQSQIKAPDSVLSAHEQVRLQLDKHGEYRGYPVHVLGSTIDSIHFAEWPGESLDLHSREMLADLFLGLKQMADKQVSVRTLYALGREAWSQRERWKTHMVHVTAGGNLLAVIDPQRWCIHLKKDYRLDHLEAAGTIIAPQTVPFAAHGFDILPLESALWAFAKRCAEPLLTDIVPTVFLNVPLSPRRPSNLSDSELGKDCVQILKTLDMQSLSANQLQEKLRLSRPALLRSLAGLALIRAIWGQPKVHAAAPLLRLLPASLRRRISGASGFF
jgi:hypothetical protein